MHKWPRILFGTFFIIIFLIGNAIVPDMTARADMSSQGGLPLSGYQIYFSENHREASRFDRSEEGLSRLGGMLQGLGAELYTLEWRAPIPANADLVIIPGPMWNLSTLEIARLWVFLNDGGDLLLLADVTANKDLTGVPSASGIFQLLWQEVGLLGTDDLIVKANDLQHENEDETVNEEDSTPLQGTSSFAEDTYFTTTNIDTTHPITGGISEELAFFAARSLEISGTSVPYRVSPLVFTEPDFYGETTLPEDLEAETFEHEYELAADIPPGALPLAIAVENIDTGSKIVIVGDREFTTNGKGLRTLSPHSFTYLYPANAQFLLNTITWLLDTEPVDLSLANPDSSTESAETTTTD